MIERASAPEGEQTLLRHAAAVVRARCRNGGYAGVSSAAADELSGTLESYAATAGDEDGMDREEAVALAHRLVDDDHPELSPLWPGPST
jgi:hypothetical protein